MCATSRWKSKLLGSISYGRVFQKTKYWDSCGERPSSNEDPPVDPKDSNDKVHRILVGFSKIYREFQTPSEGIEGPYEEARGFYKFLPAVEEELYPGYQNFTRWSFVTRFFHIIGISFKV